MQKTNIAVVLSLLAAASGRVINNHNDVVMGADLNTDPEGLIGEKNINHVPADEASVGAATAEYLIGTNANPYGSTNFKDHGGPRLTSPVAYSIFFGNQWTTSNVNMHENFLWRIGAHSYMANSRTLGGGTWSYTVTTNRRIVAGTLGSTTELNTGDKIKTVISNQIGSWGEAASNQYSYHLIVDNVKSQYMQTASTFVYGTEWCAYHSYLTKNSVNRTFSVNGWQGGSITGCSWGTLSIFTDGLSRNAIQGNQKDFQISVLAHEMAEIITDPWYDNRAWYDSVTTTIYTENGDKCNAKLGGVSVNGSWYWNFRTTNSGGSYVYYTIQTHYNYANNNCPRQTWT